jgi:hypothetical protein
MISMFGITFHEMLAQFFTISGQNLCLGRKSSLSKMNEI